MTDKVPCAAIAWLENRIKVLGLKKKTVCEGVGIRYKTLKNWRENKTEPTLTADQWIGLARTTQTDLTILLYKFAKSTQETTPRD